MTGGAAAGHGIVYYEAILSQEDRAHFPLRALGCCACPGPQRGGWAASCRKAAVRVCCAASPVLCYILSSLESGPYACLGALAEGWAAQTDPSTRLSASKSITYSPITNYLSFISLYADECISLAVKLMNY